MTTSVLLGSIMTRGFNELEGQTSLKRIVSAHQEINDIFNSLQHSLIFDRFKERFESSLKFS